MPPATQTRLRPYVRLITYVGVIVPRRLRAEWKQEWLAELLFRERLLADWDNLTWKTRLALFRRSLGALLDALWLQQLRLEDDMLQDIRYGLRILLKHKVSSSIAVLSLALGIGANTAIFSVIDALMLRSLPVKDPQRLVLFGKALSQGIFTGFPNNSCDLYSYPFYRDISRRTQSLSGLAAIHSFPNRVHGVVNTPNSNGETEQIDARLVSGTYFSVLGVEALIGRTLSESDDITPGGHPVVVASYSWWKKRFGGDPTAVGTAISIGHTNYTIIGVTPRDFFGTTVGESPDLWVPLAMEEQLPPGFKGLDNKFFQSLYLVGRLRSDVGLEQASAELNVLFKQMLHEYAGPQPSEERLRNIEQARIDLTPAGHGLSSLRTDFSLPLRILMGVVGLVLLLACANLANLLLARSTGRQQEFAVRLALGAARNRIVRQLLTESMLLAALGGAAGIALGSWGSRLLVAMVSAGPQPIPLEVGLDARVLAFTFAIAVLSALVFGTVPALRAVRMDLNPMLKERKGSSSAMTRGRLGRALLISQVAISLLLLVGAGLFVRTLVNLENIDPGFEQRNTLLFELDTDSVGLPVSDKLTTLYNEVETAVKAVPGVRAAAFSMFAFNQGGWRSFITTNEPEQKSGDRGVMHNPVGPDFFAAMGMPLLLGREFAQRDIATSPKVAVINESLSRQFFVGSPIGKRFGIGGPEKANDIEVIGVVKDAKYGDLTEKPTPMAFYPYSQSVQYLGNLEVAVSGNPGPIVAGVRQAIKEVNSRLPVVAVSTMKEQIDRSLVQQTLTAMLSAFFGVLALLLASIGLFGVMSYAAARRTNEIGVRMALGASRANVLWLVMREGMIPVIIGIVVGLPAALALAHLASSLLFGLTPNDPSTIALAIGVLLAVATVAGYLPARRAARLDPMAALRYE
jgi:predicted permease